MSVSIDLCEKLLPKYYGDDLLSAIFSGVLSGFGFSLVFVRGATTGGVDITNVDQWIKAGAVAVGAGSSLTAGAKTGDYKLITELECLITIMSDHN